MSSLLLSLGVGKVDFSLWRGWRCGESGKRDASGRWWVVSRVWDAKVGACVGGGEDSLFCYIAGVGYCSQRPLTSVAHCCEVQKACKVRNGPFSFKRHLKTRTRLSGSMTWLPKHVETDLYIYQKSDILTTTSHLSPHTQNSTEQWLDFFLRSSQLFFLVTTRPTKPRFGKPEEPRVNKIHDGFRCQSSDPYLPSCYLVARVLFLVCSFIYLFCLSSYILLLFTYFTSKLELLLFFTV